MLFHRSESEDSDLDLSKEMFPISHYVNDREEMINQVFNVIKGKKLRSMLPPFLAEMDVDEVKALCLEQVIKYNYYNVSFMNVIKNAHFCMFVLFRIGGTDFN